MATVAERLQFIGEWRTDTYLSEVSGIPRSTIGFVRRGERELPSEYASAFRRTYQSEFYSIMRDEGFPKKAAFEYSYLDPAGWRDLVGDLKEARSQIAIGWTAGAIQRAHLRGEELDPFDEYLKAFEKASIAIEESNQSWDDIKEGNLS